MSHSPDKIEFKMLDFERFENDFVSFKLEDGTIVKVKVDLDRVGVATNFTNPDGTPHYAINTSVKLSIIPSDKKFSVEKNTIKGNSGVWNYPPAEGEYPLATSITAPMVGKILKIEANKDETVEEDDVIIVMEAMKMEIPVVATSAGIIKTIKVEVGQSVEAGEELAEIE